MYDDYCSVVETPMDIGTVMERCRADYYLRRCFNDSRMAKEVFKKDVEKIFLNCRLFNEEATEIYNSSCTLTMEFKRLWLQHDMW